MSRKETPEKHYHGHRERLRGRILNSGCGGLEDYELMEALLMYAIPRKDVKPLAKELVAVFGSFASAVEAPASELEKINGVKESTVSLFALAKEAGKRLAEVQVLNVPIFSNLESLIKYCRASIAHQKIEVFNVLFLDNKNRLIKNETLQEGTVNQAMIYPREIAKRALELCAAGVILLHNHPSGDLRASKNDIKATSEAMEALKAVDVMLLDHIIVSKSGYVSFRETGLLKELRQEPA